MGVRGKRSLLSALPYMGSMAYQAYKRYRGGTGGGSGVSSLMRRPNIFGRLPSNMPGRGSGRRTRLRARSGRSFTLIRRKRSRRRLFMRRRRARIFRNFRNKVNRVQFPPVKYRNIIFQQITQNYNEQAFEPLASWMNQGTMVAIASDLGITSSTTGSNPVEFFVGKYGVDLEIVNSSPSVTYVQIYWMLATRDTTTTPSALMNNDAAQYNAVGHDMALTNLTTRLSDMKNLLKNYKVIKKQYIVMNAGAVAKSHIKRRGKAVNGEYVDFNTYLYLKNFTIVPVFRVWSQIVKNRDNVNFVVDNTSLGVKHTQWCSYGHKTKAIYQAPKQGYVVNTPATPEVWSEDTKQST